MRELKTIKVIDFETGEVAQTLPEYPIPEQVRSIKKVLRTWVSINTRNGWPINITVEAEPSIEDMLTKYLKEVERRHARHLKGNR
jgi:hypothetical protein